jgi:serine/threonine protein kinase
MYEALTGRPPFKGQSAVETLYRHINDEAPNISVSYPTLKVPLALQTLVGRALRRTPNERQSSAAILAAEIADADLQTYDHISDRSNSPAQVTQPTKTWLGAVLPNHQGIQRNRQLAAGITVLAAVAMVITIFMLARSGTAPPIAPPPVQSAHPASEKIASYERDFAANPTNYSFELNNELRHYYSSFDQNRSSLHTDIILAHDPMNGYMMSILSGWNLGKNADRAIATYQSMIKQCAKFAHIQAACNVQIGELLAARGDADAAQYFQRVINLSGDDLEPYKFLAKQALKKLKPSHS